jgi:hypothetical protein
MLSGTSSDESYYTLEWFPSRLPPTIQFDLPWTPQNVIPFGLATGSRRHHYHHRYGRHYYQKFFCHVDRLFGFVQKDDGSILGDSVKPLHEIQDTMSSTHGKKQEIEMVEEGENRV